MGNLEEFPMSENQTEELIKRVVKEAVPSAVLETLERLGIDVCRPLDMQRDFQYLRDIRQNSSNLRQKAIGIIVGLVLTGLGGLTVLGFQHWR